MNAQLIRKNLELKERLRVLTKELDFLKTFPSIGQGMKGEKFIADLTSGGLTAYAHACDVVLSGGVKVEVKFSKLHARSNRLSKRWNWSNPLGWRNKGKDYDYLLLMGEKDENYPLQYPDCSPFVFFLIPYNRVKKTMTGLGSHSLMGYIELSTNFSRAKSSKSKLIINHIVPADSIARVLQESETVKKG